MSGFTDLRYQAQPALAGGGCIGSATAGRSWAWDFGDIVDNNGDPVDLRSSAGVTGDCKIVTARGGSTVLTLGFTGFLGRFVIGADEALTAGLFTGSDYSRGRLCYWYLTITDGTDSVQVWMVDNSPFTIRRGA